MSCPVDTTTFNLKDVASSRRTQTEQGPSSSDHSARRRTGRQPADMIEFVSTVDRMPGPLVRWFMTTLASTTGSSVGVFVAAQRSCWRRRHR